MESLICRIESLKNSPISSLVKKRMSGFSRKRAKNELFSELCFCILTANYSSEGGMRMQRLVGDGFITLSEHELSAKLRSLGYRFPNVRANYIARAREHIDSVPDALSSLAGDARRRWFADNFPGLGYKESSHFLRNVGFPEYAIIDFHVVDILADNSIISRPKTLTRKRYLEIESSLAGIANHLGLSQGELDLYLWYLETGKILK